MAYIGLLLIALGTGGIKPCVASFGGEQFKVTFKIKLYPYSKKYPALYSRVLNNRMCME